MLYQSYSNILVKLRPPTIFKQDDIGKSHIPQKKPKTNGQPCTSIQGFLLGYITLSCVIWLKNDRLSKFDENIGI